MRYGAEFRFVSPMPRRLLKPRTAVTRASRADKPSRRWRFSSSLQRSLLYTLVSIATIRQADIRRVLRDVRFTPESGHGSARS
jgi:hypothetical protein